jgi:hypothetical protein
MAADGEALARRIATTEGGFRIVALDSATFTPKFYAGQSAPRHDVVLHGSYFGVLSARAVAAGAPRAAIGVDCGIGKDGAGVAGLWFFEALGLPAAAADGMTCEMGNSLDLWDNGIISRVNNLAEDRGVLPGMAVSDAARLIGKAAAPVEGQRANRTVVKQGPSGRAVVCTDSIFYASREDIETNVLCVGGHTGLSIVDFVLQHRPWGFVMSDGGVGKNQAGVQALAVFDARGIPCASVSAMTARMGDGRSTYFDGVVSYCNASAAAKGVRPGQSAIEAADLLLV